MNDWRETARRMRFNEGASWADITRACMPFFPESTEQQVRECVRSYLRRRKEYNAPKLDYNGRQMWRYEAERMTLYIIGDVHLGAYGHDNKAYRAYIDRIEDDETAKVIILGDLIDCATIGSKGNPHSQTMTPQRQIERTIELLYPIRDKILFACAGNHEERVYRSTGTDAGKYIMLGLNCLDRYHPVAGYIDIKTGKKRIKLYATHNIGRAETKIQKLAKSYADIDLILGGHIHTPKVIRTTQKVFGGQQRDITAVICGAWLMDEGYAVSAAYEPVSMAQPVIYISDQGYTVAV